MLFFYAAGLGLALAGLGVLLGAPAATGQLTREPAQSSAGLRWWPIALAALAVQVYLTWQLGVPLPAPWRVAALWATHLTLAVVVLANLRRPGMRWLLAGMALNFLVMAANGGLMPVSPETLARGGHGHALERTADGESQRKKNVVLHEDETRLALLSDRLLVPGHPGAFSVGDVFIAAGILLALATEGGAARRAMTARTVARPGAAHVWGKPMMT